MKFLMSSSKSSSCWFFAWSFEVCSLCKFTTNLLYAPEITWSTRKRRDATFSWRWLRHPWLLLGPSCTLCPSLLLCPCDWREVASRESWKGEPPAGCGLDHRPRPPNGLRCQLLPTTFNISPTSSSAAFPLTDQRTLPKIREHSKYYFAPFVLKGGGEAKEHPFLPNFLVNRIILHWGPLLFDGKSFFLAEQSIFAQSVFTFPESYACKGEFALSLWEPMKYYFGESLQIWFQKNITEKG